MYLSDLFKQKACPFAIEVFPPKRKSGIEAVYGALHDLCAIGADYISVTYSAGGSGAREYTGQISRRLKQQYGVEPLSHLTCVHARPGEVEQELAELQAAGVQNILALRGDLPPGGGPPPAYAHASDLMQEIARVGGFYLVGACYPEGHPESQGLEADIDALHHKLEAGCGHLVTQLFFDNAKFDRFLSLARQKGIDCPIEAGVMPIVKYEQLARTVSLSSASLPSAFTRWVSRFADDAGAFYEAGIDYAVRQIRALIENGADGIHLYAMNNAEVARRIHSGIRDLL
ncbi:MAG: methylenetetrahydrofolate reductase [NAD(P)H] [Clostridiales bacterium]|nr:methylenetetrahydrofolate reductase [NAD(P)H] [Clostridiales bacterium]